jgi:hypothetical protein
VLAADPVTLTPQHSQLFRFGAAISPEQAADLAEVTLKVCLCSVVRFRSPFTLP